jgi:hypothetical protein
MKTQGLETSSALHLEHKPCIACKLGANACHSAQTERSQCTHPLYLQISSERSFEETQQKKTAPHWRAVLDIVSKDYF